RQPPVRDARRVLKQLGLQRIALRVRERFDDAPRRTRGDDVRVYEAIVVRRDLHMIELAQRCELPPPGKPAPHRSVELENPDRRSLEQRPAAVARQLALPG